MTKLADHAPSTATDTTMNSTGPVVPRAEVNVGNELVLQPGLASPRRVPTVPTGPDMGPADMVTGGAIAGRVPVTTSNAARVPPVHPSTEPPSSRHALRSSASFAELLERQLTPSTSTRTREQGVASTAAMASW